MLKVKFLRYGSILKMTCLSVAGMVSFSWMLPTSSVHEAVNLVVLVLPGSVNEVVARGDDLDVGWGKNCCRSISTMMKKRLCFAVEDLFLLGSLFLRRYRQKQRDEKRPQ